MVRFITFTPITVWFSLLKYIPSANISNYFYAATGPWISFDIIVIKMIQTNKIECEAEIRTLISNLAVSSQVKFPNPLYEVSWGN